MVMRRRRTAVVLSVLFICLVLLSVRIYCVNVDVLHIETEHHPMGEWVELDGTILSSSSSENPAGYSIKVNSAQAVSYDEYVAAFGTDAAASPKGLGEKSVVVLDMEIRNVGNDKWGIPLLPMRLIPERKNTYFIWNDDLWAESEPNAKDATHLVTRVDSEYETHLPFTINNFDDEFTAFKTPITDTRFTLVLSNAPVRRVIDVVVDSA